MKLDQYEQRKKEKFLHATSDIDYNLFFDLREQLITAAEIIHAQDEIIEEQNEIIEEKDEKIGDVEFKNDELIEERYDQDEYMKEQEGYIKELQWILDKHHIAR